MYKRVSPLIIKLHC